MTTPTDNSVTAASVQTPILRTSAEGTPHIEMYTNKVDNAWVFKDKNGVVHNIANMEVNPTNGETVFMKMGDVTIPAEFKELNVQNRIYAGERIQLGGTGYPHVEMYMSNGHLIARRFTDVGVYTQVTVI